MRAVLVLRSGSTGPLWTSDSVCWESALILNNRLRRRFKPWRLESSKLEHVYSVSSNVWMFEEFESLKVCRFESLEWWKPERSNGTGCFVVTPASTWWPPVALALQWPSLGGHLVLWCYSGQHLVTIWCSGVTLVNTWRAPDALQLHCLQFG